MTEPPSTTRFKPEMPRIPGVSDPSSPKPPQRNPFLPLLIGVLVVGVLLFAASRWLSRSKPVEHPRAEPAAQIEVPSPTPDPSASLPRADEIHPAIATVVELAKAWSSADFFIRNKLTGEMVPATIVRLPGGAPSQAASYWAFSRTAPYGSCQLEYIPDLGKLRKEYGFGRATHPLVGNPCSRTLYDPLKTADLPGNVFVRGAIVQGGDIRPPFSIEIQLRGKQILAIRTE